MKIICGCGNDSLSKKWEHRFLRYQQISECRPSDIALQIQQRLERLRANKTTYTKTTEKLREDYSLEAQIEDAYSKAISCDEISKKGIYLNHMRELINQRSPEQVQRMEEERGLI